MAGSAQSDSAVVSFAMTQGDGGVVSLLCQRSILNRCVKIDMIGGEPVISL